MKMDLRESLLVFTMLCGMSSSMRCYKCTPRKDDYRQVQLCEHFDYSEKYITECKGSTMCYKKEISSSLGNGIKLYERNCAPQTQHDEQELVNHQWVYVNKIYEPYEEGCKKISQDEKITNTVNCYCRGDLCNKGTVRTSEGVMVVITPILIKYLLQ